MIRYAKVDTQSVANNGKTPSSIKQFDLARMLFNELNDINASDVYLDETNCVVYARIPANTPNVKAFGLITHMDTATEASGTNVKPWVFENYQGQDITLNKELGIVMKFKDYPNLTNYIGEDIIFTDGTTLLGGDDKAGISAVMTMAEYLIKNPEILHGEIDLAFTPDEEVGGLARNLDFKRFNAKVAYTLDGDHKGYYSFETFNALEAMIHFNGLSVHTGTAKGIMKNAVRMSYELLNKLPLERPENTSDREGFFHPLFIEGNTEKAYLRILIRDFDSNKFNERIELIKSLVEETNNEYGPNSATVEFGNGYPNMGEYIKKEPYLVTNLVNAIKKSNVDPVELPFRGGTDGAALSKRGLPCPSLSSGYENAHGRFEYVPIGNMEKNVEILLNLVEIFKNM